MFFLLSSGFGFSRVRADCVANLSTSWISSLTTTSSNHADVVQSFIMKDMCCHAQA